MSPNGKGKVIRILKENDGVVLMCGDGGNDAGALKQAEVGLALFAGKGATNTEEPVQSAGEGDSDKMPNERQLEIAKRAKDVQKLRAQFIKDKQKELHRSWDKGWALSTSAEGNARGPSGRKPHGGFGASEGKCRPEAMHRNAAPAVLSADRIHVMLLVTWYATCTSAKHCTPIFCC